MEKVETPTEIQLHEEEVVKSWISPRNVGTELERKDERDSDLYFSLSNPRRVYKRLLRKKEPVGTQKDLKGHMCPRKLTGLKVFFDSSKKEGPKSTR